MKNVCKYGLIISAILYGGEGTASQGTFLQMMLWPETAAQDLPVQVYSQVPPVRVYSQAPLHHIGANDYHAEGPWSTVAVQPYTFSYKLPPLIQKRKRTLQALDLMPERSRMYSARRNLRKSVVWGCALKIIEAEAIRRYEECLSTKFGHKNPTPQEYSWRANLCLDMVTECVGTIKAALLPIYDEWHDEIQRIGSSFFVRFKAPTGNPEIDIQYFFQQLEISFGYLRTVRKQGDATTVCAKENAILDADF